LRASNVGVIEQQLRAAQDRFALGEVTRTDVAIAEARLAAARSALAAATGELAVARESYKLAVGRYPADLAEPPTPPKPAASLEAALVIARDRQPAIVQSRHILAASEINVARAKAQMGPRVGVGGALSFADSGVQNRSVQLSFSQPLYQGGLLSARLRAAIAQRDEDAAALHRAAAEVDRNVAQAWARLDVARASIEAGTQQVAAARAAFESVSEEAQFGARTTLEVLNAEQELRDAEAGRLSAIASEQKSAYGLLATMGLLTVADLKLGVPVYDVSAYHDAVKSAPVSPEGRRLDRILSVLGQTE
jgi:outer membrane protein